MSPRARTKAVEPPVEDPEGAVEPRVIAAPTVDDGTIKPGELRRFPGVKNYRENGHRRIKMARPICKKSKMLVLGLPEGQACQDPENRRPGWWLTCPHEPYFSIRQENIRRPIFGPPLQGGRRKVLKWDESLDYVERPNLVQVSLTKRHNWARGPALWKEERGFLLPQDIGVAPYCEYQDCWSHDIAIRSRYGNFCEEWQARLIGIDFLGRPLEVGAPNLPGTAEKRAEQLAAVAL